MRRITRFRLLKFILWMSVALFCYDVAMFLFSGKHKNPIEEAEKKRIQMVKSFGGVGVCITLFAILN